MDFVRSDWDGWLDEHGGDDRLTFTASEIKAFLAEIDRLRAELERATAETNRSAVVLFGLWAYPKDHTEPEEG